jgi:hypothetical protein
MFIVDGKEIVILEAALLLDASWNNLVHEVWTSIVPSIFIKKNIISQTTADFWIILINDFMISSLP